MLCEGLILLVLHEAPYVIGEFADSFLQLYLSLRVLSQIREFLRELVVAINEILNQSADVLILFRKVEIYELGLHLGEALENVRSLILDGSEDQEALAIVVQLEVLPDFNFHFIVENDLLL